MKRLSVLIAALVCFFNISVLASQGRIVVSDVETLEGEEFSTVVSLSDVPAAVGSVVVEYDNSYIQIIDSEFSDSFNEISPLINLKYKDNQIKFNWLSMRTDINFTDFMTLKFKALKSGSTEITIVKCDLYDIAENKINIEVKNSKVKVGAVLSNTGHNNGGSMGKVSSQAASENHSSEESGRNKDDDEKFFEDIDSVPWAHSSIKFLTNAGIIRGMSETEFAPLENIKRADYLILLVRMLSLSNEASENFDDVMPDSYYYNEVGIAKAAGLTSGVGDNKFEPEKKITRQDMFVLAYRILKMYGAYDSDAEETELKIFSDCNEISQYAREPVAALTKSGLIAGNYGKIMAFNEATRAETAVLIYKLYQQLGFEK